MCPLLAAATPSVHQTERLVFFTLLQLIAILASARLAGKIARLFGQSRVVGEIVGGLVMGPSLFGKLFPAQFAFVFQSIPMTPLVILSQIGLALLMFQIGLEFDFSHLKEKRNRKAVISISAAGIIVPFILGWLIGLWSHPFLAPEIPVQGYRAFIAVALSITAIPVLGRIMMELGINKLPIGAIAITAAALDDMTGWTLLAIVSAQATAEFSASTFAMNVGLLLAYLALCCFLFKPWLHRLVNRLLPDDDRLPHDLMAIMIMVIFISGLITYQLGIFVIFGGFVAGVMLHDHHRFVAAWKKTVSHFVTVFFLPIFFTFTGLRTNVGGLDSLTLWGWCLAIIGAATVGKFAGCSLAARCCGLGWPDAGCIGIMMNTRALMELVVINVGFDLGVIPSTVFTMLVLMAILSTVITAPFLRYFFGRIGYKYVLHADV
jgi:Kef-type K+ transport system membrane component KefB